MNKSRRHAAGFTLLEVIVALGITATGIAALTSALGGRADRAALMETRVMGEWLAGNRIADLRLRREWPAPGEYRGEGVQGEQTLYYVERVSDTDDPDLRRIDVQVFSDESREHAVAALFGYLSRFRAPG